MQRDDDDSRKRKNPNANDNEPSKAQKTEGQNASINWKNLNILMQQIKEQNAQLSSDFQYNNLRIAALARDYEKLLKDYQELESQLNSNNNSNSAVSSEVAALPLQEEVVVEDTNMDKQSIDKHLSDLKQDDDDEKKWKAAVDLMLALQIQNSNMISIVNSSERYFTELKNNYETLKSKYQILKSKPLSDSNTATPTQAPHAAFQYAANTSNTNTNSKDEEPSKSSTDKNLPKK